LKTFVSKKLIDELMKAKKELEKKLKNGKGKPRKPPKPKT
jgi:hypothetical protein